MVSGVKLLYFFWNVAIINGQELVVILDNIYTAIDDRGWASQRSHCDLPAIHRTVRLNGSVVGAEKVKTDQMKSGSSRACGVTFVNFLRNGTQCRIRRCFDSYQMPLVI